MVNTIYIIILFRYTRVISSKKISIQINVAIWEGISWNKIWHRTKDEIGKAAQSWTWVRVEAMVWYVSRLVRLKTIQRSWVQIQLRPTFCICFKEVFIDEYHLFPQFIQRRSCYYLNKILAQINMATEKGISQNKMWHLKKDEIGVAAQS